MGSIYLVRKINVLPGNIIIVPGTEPSTTVTSTTLELEIRKAGRQSPAIISLKSALELIPGSHVEILSNYNAPVQKLFVLPEENLLSCCVVHPDWYELLREGSREASDDEKRAIATCSSIDDYDMLYGS